MKSFRSSLVALGIILASSGYIPSTYAAVGDFRLSGGLGIVTASNSSGTDLSAGLEFEYRMHEFMGLGGFGTYVFSNPGFTLVGLPEVFLHPLAGDWYVSAAPIVEFGGGLGTHWGARLGTRIPFSIGALSLVPQVSVDFINGGKLWSFGLGISI